MSTIKPLDPITAKYVRHLHAALRAKDPEALLALDCTLYEMFETNLTAFLGYCLFKNLLSTNTVRRALNLLPND